MTSPSSGVSATDPRQLALRCAVDLVIAGVGSPAHIVSKAQEFYVWLGSFADNLAVTLTVIFADGTATITHYNSSTQESAFMQLPDNATATITVLPEDAAGNVTPDQLAYTEDGGGAVIALAPAADTHSCTVSPVALGSATVSVADPANPALAPFTVQFDVIAGPTTQLLGNVVINPPA